MRMGPNDNFIKGAAYVGISANQPADNYFMAMITEAKFSKVFAILGDTITPKFHEWAKIIPAAIMDSGLEPFHKDRCEAHKKAKAVKAVSSTVSKQSQLDPSCFAYISVSPAASKVLRIPIRPGIHRPRNRNEWSHQHSGIPRRTRGPDFAYTILR